MRSHEQTPRADDAKAAWEEVINVVNQAGSDLK